MKKLGLNGDIPKISKILQKLDKFKQPTKKFVRKSNRHESVKVPFKIENDLFQKKIKVDVHSQAIQTLTDAALNIKDLLSDFLMKVEDDKDKVFNIEEELEKIKENKKQTLNIYSLIGGKESDKESDFISKRKNNINNEKGESSNLDEDYLRINQRFSLKMKKPRRSLFTSENNLNKNVKKKVVN
jgi:hypothetical protein